MHSVEGGPNLGLEPERLCVPAKVSGEVVGVHSAGIGPEGAHRRLPRAAREADPARPHGTGARGSCGCQCPVQVGRGAASCPRLQGGGTQEERSGNRAPAEALCARPQRLLT